MLMANAPAANVSLRIGARGGVHAPVSACASSNEAIALAFDLIRLERADIALVGGTEAVIHPLPMAAFGQMQALSRRNDEPEKASRPFDVDHDGFVLGEGGACMVIETPRARSGPRRAHLRHARWRRYDVGRPRHGEPRCPRPGDRDAQGPLRGAPQPGGHRAHQRSRHVDTHR